MTDERRQRAFRAFNALWVVPVCVAPVIAAGLNPALLNQLDLFLALVAFAYVSGNIVLRVSVGGNPFVFSVGTPPIVLACVYLPPAAAMLVCLALTYDLYEIRNRSRPWRVFSTTAALAAGAGVGAWVTQLAFGTHPEGMKVLPAVILATVSCISVQTLTQALLEEQTQRGVARKFLLQVKMLLLFDATISATVAAIASPFIAEPLIVFAVLSAFQAFVYVVTRISASESLHKEKSQHLRQAFSRYVPASVAEALADSGEEIKLGGDEREISVLFCDIRGFTAWSETVEAEVVIEQLNALLRGLSASVLETGGTLDKYTGDGLMAFWGAPLAQPDHADRALQAAINMLGRLDECNAERAKQGLKPFAIGIGIHSGTAVVGNIGHEDRLDYTAIGDTVNTAARLEAATKEVGSVLVFSDRTYSELLPTRQRLCRSAGDVTVKGKAEPISVYALEEGSSDELADRWDAAFMTPDERAA